MGGVLPLCIDAVDVLYSCCKLDWCVSVFKYGVYRHIEFVTVYVRISRVYEYVYEYGCVYSCIKKS